jgi:hypothetical protein
MFFFASIAPQITGINVAPPLGLVDPLFIGIPVSFVLVTIVSLATQSPPEEHITKGFTGIS